MAKPESEVGRWMQEVLSLSQELYNLSVRAEKLRRKTAAGGYYVEPAPSGWAGAPIEEIRSAYNLLAVDLTNFFGNAAVGTADRTSAYWQAHWDAGI